MTIPIKQLGGDGKYLIERGAWTRGGELIDLEVRVEYAGDGSVDHVSISHRSLTTRGVDMLGLLIHSRAGQVEVEPERPADPGREVEPPR